MDEPENRDMFDQPIIQEGMKLRYPLNREGVHISNSQRSLIEESLASGNTHQAQTYILNILDNHSVQSAQSYLTSLPAVSTLTQQECIDILRKISNVAMSTGDLSILLKSNGKCGWQSNKVYSLIAKATGVSRAHVSKILNGDSRVSLRTIEKISKVTNVDVDDIVRYLVEIRKREQ